ncbi:MAG TPA: hypothetical protein P5275_11620 [Saprospiraceae bacterium]|nr:hypothetical protein [Saprospiraceae bacterium]HRV85507.1 hypothetical protein [Saprospiraceae bacterium]
MKKGEHLGGMLEDSSPRQSDKKPGRPGIECTRFRLKLLMTLFSILSLPG